MPITPSDKTAAHSLWVELATRITTQRLHYRSGDEETAARSIHALFGKTRELMEKNPEAMKFQEVAGRMLNHTIRPFTARWHGWMVPDANLKDKDGQPLAKFRDPQVRRLFRAELRELQPYLLGYQKAFDLMRQGKDKDAKGVTIEALVQPAKRLLEQLSKECRGPLGVSLGTDLELSVGDEVEVAGNVTLDQIVEEERKEIFARRTALNMLQMGDKESHVSNVSGLALSGGGIRSATFCLGIVQVLVQLGLFRRFDYLSTVSGGGYLGTFLSTALGTRQEGDESSNTKDSAVKKIDDVFQRQEGIESGLVRHLRNNSKYLLNGGLTTKLEIGGLLISGILWNMLMLLPLPLFAALIAYHLQIWLWGGTITTGTFAHPDWSQGSAASVAIFFGVALVVTWAVQPVVKMFTHGADPKSSGMIARNCLERLTPWIGVLFLATAFVNCIPTLFYGYEMLRKFVNEINPDWFHSKKINDLLGVSAGGMLSAGLGLLAARLAPRRELLRKLAVKLFIISGPLLLLLVFLAVGNRMGLGRTIELVPTVSFMGMPFLVPSVDFWTEAQTQWSAGWVLLVTLGITAWGWLGVNINTLAPHIYYRNSLCGCYMVRRIAEAQEKLQCIKRWLSGEKVQGRAEVLQRVRFESMNKDLTAPYHLLNMTLNVPSSDNKNLRGRASDFFVASRLFCGSPLTGYKKTAEVVAVDPHFDLGTAMAVSGAAASTSMGWKSLPNFRFLMTLFNVRLGYWLRWSDKAVRENSPWNKPGPWYFLREMFGIMSEKNRYLNLSDGGHIENLAVYELLRRQTKFIVCVDGGQEPGMECTDLIRLQRYAEIDLGICMHYDLLDLALLPEKNCRAYGLLVKIDYEPEANHPPEKAKLGWMLYLKLAMTGTEPVYVLDYRRENPFFPHETTGDQIFDEAQFEAYRHLGECAMESFFRDELLDKQPENLSEWFESLCSHLLPDNDEAVVKHTKAAK
ncbi:patatin-like phospholipase family protein [Prosthecobacter sp.]|uniref:patatin-like phospholipase family protein n=1 Tax=Prosthecobacter sp. TaxID=1965333 RepID=UPI002AB8E6F8|nr:patatin-like phospholipase family protein [Prosthecobacter sp.]MDZ4403289.1 patatin-like phospholipase family protein [Prosthecobacter sp.]